MSDCQRILNLKPHYEETRNTLNYQGLSGVVATKLKTLKPFGIDYVDEEILEIIEMFEHDSRDESLNVDGFNSAMSILYDWADQSLDGKIGGKKLCWVQTS